MTKSTLLLLCGLILPGWPAGHLAAQPILTKQHEFSGLETASQNVGFIEGPNRKFYGWASHAGEARRSVLWRINPDGSEFAVLHVFSALSEEGEDPTGLTYASDGKLYGVARDQQSLGRIFSLSADGSGYLVLKRFDAVTDMTSNPFGLIQASDGRLYGVTGTGGPGGVIYGMNRDGTGYHELHRFGLTQTDGQFPRGSVLEGPDGVLFGVTASDRTAFLGTVYRIGRDGSGYQIIHQFTGAPQGIGPNNGLIHATDGFLYGQADRGGENNGGGLFKLRPDGSDYQFIRTDAGGSQWYQGVSESSDGYLYAALPGGGPQFNGTIFRVMPNGSGYETLHAFSRPADPPEGVRPKQLVHASDGFLYCITHQQSPTPIATLTAYTPFLMRFGPVPLPRTSPAITIISRIVREGSSGQFNLSFTGEPGREYEIQAADALPADWRSAQRITADGQGQVEFLDDSVNSRTTRLFRVVTD